MTVEEAREWVFAIAYFLIAPPPTRPLTPDEVDGMAAEEIVEVKEVIEEVSAMREEISEVKEDIEEEEDSDSDMIISNIGRPEFVQAGVSSSEDEVSDDETAELEDETIAEDETPILENISPIQPAPTPVRDPRACTLSRFIVE